MEEKESSASGVAARGEEAPESFRFAPINENPSQSDGPTVQPATVPATPSPANAAVTGTQGKKKRGRPRKYAPDGTVSLALSPMPISSSIPLTGDFSWKQRGRVRPIESIKKSQKYETFENSGQRISYSVGANFTPHVLTVNAGEDVTMKVMSFSQQGARAICILSANGTISNVTLRQPTSSGGTLTYEGRFEILSLSGSFMPTENAGTKSRSGGMSVSLAGPDGRVMGGGLAGLLIAAGPVQVVVGSFLPGHQQEQKPKKQRVESISAVSLPIVTTISSEEIRGGYGVKPIMTSTGFHADNASSLNTIQGYKNSAPENKEDSSPLNHPLNHPIQGYNNSIPENKSSLAEEESKGLSQPNCEVSC